MEILDQLHTDQILGQLHMDHFNCMHFVYLIVFFKIYACYYGMLHFF